MKRELIVTAEGRDRTVIVDTLGDGRFEVTVDGTPNIVDAREVRPGTWSLVIASPANAGRAVPPEAVRSSIASPANAGRAVPPEAVRSSIASPANAGRAVPPEAVRSSIDGKSFLVDLDPRRGGIAASVGDSEAMLQVEDALHRRLAAAAGPRDKARGETIRAPIAGKVVKVLVAVGDVVAAGTPVFVLEAMKMENELVAERGGTVTAIHKQAGQAVDTGEVLVEMA